MSTPTTPIRVRRSPYPEEFGPHNLAYVSGVPSPDDRYARFRLVLDRDGHPVQISAGKSGPIRLVELEDGTRLAAKFFQSRDRHPAREMLLMSSHEMRRGAQNLGPHFVEALALWEWVDEYGAPNYILLMTYVSGRPLDDLADESLSPESQRNLTAQMLTILGTLQQSGVGVVHQDIKPKNLIVADDGTLVLIDFGSSRRPDDATYLTSEHTQQFLAPEVFESMQDPDGETAFSFASDEFAAGLTLLEIFTGREPYVGRPADLWRTRVGVPNLDDPRLDDRVRRVITGMLAQDPEKRWSIEDLAAILSGDSDAHPSRQATIPAQPDYGTGNDGQTVKIPTFQPIQPMSQPADPNGGAAGAGASAPSTPPEDTVAAKGYGRVAYPHRSGEPGAWVHEPFVEPSLVPPVSLDPYRRRKPAPRSRWMDFAGVDSTIVYEKHERILFRFAATALMIFVLYIIFGMGAYILQATDNRTYALVGALTIGVIIAIGVANVDRSLLGSVRTDVSDILKPIDPNAKPPNPVKFASGVLVRVMIALAASYLFADTLAVELNRKSVEQAIINDLSTAGGPLETQALAITAEAQPQLDSLREQASAAQAKLTDLLEAPGRYEELAAAEMRGEGSTGVRGCGPQCQQWQAQRDLAQERLLANEADFRAEALAAEQAVETKEEEIALTILGARDTTVQRAISPDAMSDTLLSNAMESPRGFMRYFGLMILFLGIEMAVLLIKLITTGGAYEQEVKSRVRLSAKRSVSEYQLAAQEIDIKARTNPGLMEHIVDADTEYRHGYLDVPLRPRRGAVPRAELDR